MTASDIGPDLSPLPLPLPSSSAPGRAREVFVAFLKLGLTSFGGPIAHIGYFRRAFVEQRRWLDDAHFSQLLALCQFLPGPASSQLGCALGLLRAGWRGALAAFAGFTLPSALLLFAFAAWAPYLDSRWGQAVLHGLKLVALVVVAQGLLGMLRTLAPDGPRRVLALAAATMLLWQPQASMQLLVIAAAAALGPWMCRAVQAHRGDVFVLNYTYRDAIWLLLAYALLLLGALAASAGWPWLLQAAAAFYRSGALVFGGGHVVLPLLKQALVTPGWLDEGSFLAGYGAAQAVPGPMFSLAAFLGSSLHGGQGGVLGAMVGLLAIFLPGLLLVTGMLPFWQRLSARDDAVRAVAGINAAVIGLLAAAFYDPLWTGAVHAPIDLVIVAVGLAVLVFARKPVWLAMLWCVGVSLCRAWF
ncbi:chromate efflux transporter [Dyella tabacisoli]|uniref:Chromate ion family chromate transporter n=1 Tax=Dyella tabacisoli TaxID=2282381 RepID=A0A369UJK1_9GAMM|nr:chromate efflux transporter [Dyella tabacisoli]RDD80697.1 chromate ion family chromate transporter [Dyella tabacisoli]